MNHSDITTLQKYLIKINEWEECRSKGTSKGRSIYQHVGGTRSEYREKKDFDAKQKLTCFHCRKLGHLSSFCRSKIASERQPTQPTPQAQTIEVTAKPRGETTGRSDRKPIVCFTCQQKGHKSPQCPQKATKIKRIEIPRNKIVQLKRNKLFGSIGGHSMPIATRGPT